MHEPCLTFEAGLVSRWADRQELSIVSLAQGKRAGPGGVEPDDDALSASKTAAPVLPTHRDAHERTRTLVQGRRRSISSVCLLDLPFPCTSSVLLLRTQPRMSIL